MTDTMEKEWWDVPPFVETTEWTYDPALIAAESRRRTIEEVEEIVGNQLENANMFAGMIEKQVDAGMLAVGTSNIVVNSILSRLESMKKATE